MPSRQCPECTNVVVFDKGDSYSKCGCCGCMVRNFGYMAPKPILPASYRRRCDHNDCGGQLQYSKTYQSGEGFVHSFICERCFAVYPFKGAQV